MIAVQNDNYSGKVKAIAVNKLAVTSKESTTQKNTPTGPSVSQRSSDESNNNNTSDDHMVIGHYQTPVNGKIREKKRFIDIYGDVPLNLYTWSEEQMVVGLSKLMEAFPVDQNFYLPLWSAQAQFILNNLDSDNKVIKAVKTIIQDGNYTIPNSDYSDRLRQALGESKVKSIKSKSKKKKASTSVKVAKLMVSPGMSSSDVVFTDSMDDFFASGFSSPTPVLSSIDVKHARSQGLVLGTASIPKGICSIRGTIGNGNDPDHVENLKKRLFLIDSGAARHTCGDKDLFIEGSQKPVNYDVIFAKTSAKSHASIAGDIWLDKEANIRLTGVLYVPGVDTTLLSTSQLANTPSAFVAVSKIAAVLTS